MNPEDVPTELVELGMKAHTLFPRLPRIPMPPFPTSDDARKLLIREIIAAVAPLIAKAERERCAKVAEDRHLGWIFPHPDDAKPGEVCDDATACADIAAAIRALT